MNNELKKHLESDENGEPSPEKLRELEVELKKLEKHLVKIDEMKKEKPENTKVSMQRIVKRGKWKDRIRTGVIKGSI
ncbi:hypothetical protein [Bacillus sp. JJ722]|uniref:hypothetical protein n=1 Tax=Bacillus sp. JJ722 TaxID=3122973 RepID=UPI002FFD7D98